MVETGRFWIDSSPGTTSGRDPARLRRYFEAYALNTAGTVARLDLRAVLRDGDVLGRLLDTFVVAQLRAELAVCTTRPRLHHMREEHGRHEIDVIAELGGGDLLAFEVKADAAPGADAARHLTWLRDRIGGRFVHGLVFHTGPNVYELEERITAVPICALWAQTSHGCSCQAASLTRCPQATCSS